MGNGVVLQSDGKIVVAGTDSDATSERALVARFSSAGALDGGFGTDGVAQVAPSMGAALGRAVALQPDGKILLGGDQPYPGGSNVLMARLKGSDGTLDTSYGSTGIVTTPFMHPGAAEFNGYAVAVAPNGDVRTAGDSAATAGDNKSNFFVGSSSANGAGVGSSGFDLGGDDHARAIAVEADARCSWPAIRAPTGAMTLRSCD